MIKVKKTIYEKKFKKLSWISSYLANTCSFRGIDKQDLEQELSITLFLSIKRYYKKKQNFEKIGSIIQYCYVSCRNKRISYIRKLLTKKSKNKVFFEDLQPEEREVEKTYDAITSDIRYNRIMIQGKDVLRNQPDILKRKVFYKKILGYSYDEIAETFNVPVSDVRNWIHETRKKIKKNI